MDSRAETTAIGHNSSGIEKAVHSLLTFSNRINSGLAVIASIIVVISAAMTLVDLIGRRFFGFSIVGALEIQALAIGIIAFFTIGHTLAKNAHSRVELIFQHFSSATKIFLDLVFRLWAGGLFGVIGYQLILGAIHAAQRGQATGTIEIPMFPFMALAALGCFVFVLQSCVQYLAGAVATRNHKSDTLNNTVFFSIVVGLLPFLLAFVLRDIASGIDRNMFATLSILIMVFILLIGFPVSFTMGLIGYIGLCYFFDAGAANKIVQLKAFDSVQAHYLIVAPFFIIMGLLIFKSGIGRRIYLAGERWAGHLPGGLAIGTVFGCTGFAAMTGDSLSGTATMGTIALPEMERAKYNKAMAAGAIAAGGTLGILIPPSLGFVFYGIITEQSISKLLMSGLIPGILMALMFSAVIFVKCLLNPTLGPRAQRSSWAERFAVLWSIFPFIILAAIIVIGIYAAWFTVTEAGAIGLVGAFLLALSTGTLSFSIIGEVFMSAMELVGMVMAILISVAVFGHFVTAAGLPHAFAEAIANLDVSRWFVFFLILLLYLILGMFMNIIPMILLTMPLIFPTVVALGFDPIWFGVVIVIMMEMGTITPPIGINVFVLHGVAKTIPMGQMFIGIVPFVICMALMILLLAVFPQLALWIPDNMSVLADVDF